MAINLTRLATCWGKLVGALNELNAFRGTTLNTRVNTLNTQFTAIDSTLDDDLPAAKSSAIAANDGWVSYLGQKALAVLKSEVQNDRNVADTSTLGLLQEVQRQMVTGAQTFDSSPSTATVAAVGVPTGAPAFVTSVIDPVNGLGCDFILPDVFVMRAVTPTQLTVAGNTIVSPSTRPTWPGGNQIVTTVSLIDPSAGGIGADSGLESWASGSALNSWTTVSGAIAQVSHGSGFAASIPGTGAAIVPLRQKVSVSAGGVYAVSVSLRRSVGAGTGTLTVVFENAAGTQIGSTSLSQSIPALSTSFAQKTATLYVPTGTTGDVYLSLHCDHAAGNTIEVDDFCLATPTRLGTNGVYLTVFVGATAMVYGDTWTLTVANTGVATTSLVRGLDRLFGLSAYPVRLPTVGGGSTLNDTLVS